MRYTSAAFHSASCSCATHLGTCRSARLYFPGIKPTSGRFQGMEVVHCYRAKDQTADSSVPAGSAVNK